MRRITVQTPSNVLFLTMFAHYNKCWNNTSIWNNVYLSQKKLPSYIKLDTKHSITFSPITIRSLLDAIKTYFLTFSLHCSCPSTSHLFTLRLRLVYSSTLKIANDLSIFAPYYALLCVCYCFSHLIVFFSVTWLCLLYKFTKCFICFLFLSSYWRRASARNVRQYTNRYGQYNNSYLYSLPTQHTPFINLHIKFSFLHYLIVSTGCLWCIKTQDLLLMVN